MKFFDLMAHKAWMAGGILVIAIAAIVYGPRIKERVESQTDERKCMAILESAAQAARMKHSEQHAQAIFTALAAPECKAYLSHK